MWASLTLDQVPAHVLATITHGTSGVIHTASLLETATTDIDLLRAVNVEGTRQIVEVRKTAAAWRQPQADALILHPPQLQPTFETHILYRVTAVAKVPKNCIFLVLEHHLPGWN